MAWENVIGGNATLGEGATCGLVNPTLFANENPTGNPGQGQYISDASVLSTFELGDLRLNANPTRRITLDLGYFDVTYYNRLDPPGAQWTLSGGYSNVLSCSPSNTYWDVVQPYLVCGIDEENYLGKVGLLFKYRTGAPGGFTDWCCYWTQNANNSQMYTWIKTNILPLITYQWQSVLAISGKNGILSLPVLIDTDGNPVSNGSASDFSTLPDSVKVRTLADLAVQ